MPHAIFKCAEDDYRLFQTDWKGNPVGPAIARRASEEGALKLLPLVESARTATFDIPRELVALVCPACAEKMAARGWPVLKVREGKAAASDLLQGICEVVAPPGSEPWDVSVYMNGGIDPDTWDTFEMWIYHACELPQTGGMLSAQNAKRRFELKSIPQYQFKTEDGDDPRVKRQVFAVFGHVDSVGDRINLGATKKTIQENLRRLRVLWQHDFDSPPIGVPLDVTEKTIQELPPDAAEFYRSEFPDATGVLLASVKYLDTPRGNEVLEGINAGAITENSIGFSTVNGKTTYTVENGKRIRELFEIRLWDISPVNWGANDATTNLKRIGPVQYSEDDLVHQVEALHPLLAELKAGRVLSDANLTRLRAAMEALQEILATAEPLDVEADDEKAAQDQALTVERQRLLHRLRLAEAELYQSRG